MAARSPSLLLRLFLVPLRLVTGWGRPLRRLGFLATCMLVLLRFCIGFHFYSEGMDKMSGDFDAGVFFANARGPLAGHYQGQVWDWDAHIRLDKERTEKHWANFRERLKKHYGFDDKQGRLVDLAFVRAQTQLTWILSSNTEDIEEFELGRSRLAQLDSDATRDGVDSLGKQRDTIRKEWRQLITPILKQIDATWENLEREANAVATPQQRLARGEYSLTKPRDQAIDTSVINPIIPYFDLLIGICLIFGLFTPAVALVATGFLGSVFLSQFPPVTGPGSTYYHMVEAAGCLVLAATGAGRYAGIDFILYAICGRLWPSSSEQ